DRLTSMEETSGCIVVVRVSRWRSSASLLMEEMGMRWFAFLASALLTTALAFAQDVPPGTVIPIMLTTTVDSAKAHAGQEIAGTVMEAVPLPSGSRIPAKAKLLGHVVAARLGYPESPALLALQFDKIVFRGHET